MNSLFDDIPQPPGWPPLRFGRFAAALGRAIVRRQHRGRGPRPAFDVGARRHLAWTAADFLLARDALAATRLAEHEHLIDEVADALAARLSRRDEDDPVTAERAADGPPSLPELAPVVALFGPARFELVDGMLRAPLPGASRSRTPAATSRRGAGSVPAASAARGRARRRHA